MSKLLLNQNGNLSPNTGEQREARKKIESSKSKEEKETIHSIVSVFTWQ